VVSLSTPLNIQGKSFYPQDTELNVLRKNKMNITTSKNLGGIGALLMFIGVIPYISTLGIIEIIGLILVMIALHNIASHYMDRGIFNNAIWALVIGLVGGVVAIVTVVATVLPNLTNFLHTVYPSWNGDWTALSGLTPDTSAITIETMIPFIVGFLAAFVILWIVSIIAAFFVRRSLKTLTAKSGVGLFGTAGLLMLIGAFLAIIAIGIFLFWIALLLLAVAFFSLRTETQQPETPIVMPTQV